MVRFDKLAKTSLMVAMVCGIFCAGARGALPQGEYDCQVFTEGGGPGLVQAQVDSREEAIAVARRSKARTIDGRSKPTAKVVQCIRKPDERFSDVAFQAIYENFPQ